MGSIPESSSCPSGEAQPQLCSQLILDTQQRLSDLAFAGGASMIIHETHHLVPNVNCSELLGQDPISSLCLLSAALKM